MSLPPFRPKPPPKPTDPPSEFSGDPIAPRLSDFVPPPVVEPPPVPVPALVIGDAITIDTGKGTIEATVTAVTPVAPGVDDITLEPVEDSGMAVEPFTYGDLLRATEQIAEPPWRRPGWTPPPIG